MKGLNKDNAIFALDIGTRSVIGIVGFAESKLFNVCFTECEEYKTRAVVDGQIEDIEETASIAAAVKKRLEDKAGFALKSVHIAAAGRALKTVEAKAELAIENDEPLTGDFVSALEREGIQKAYKILQSEIEAKDESFFCVGHAVKTYYLDAYPMSTLIGHKGKTAAADIIVTFLPREVMESLYGTMNRIGLSVAGLTLEPIAAMNVIIPPELRMINLALCDIGAGTSDIALCDKGSVTAYTMATIAGDEITEELMRDFIVDFETAENIKIAMSADEKAPIRFMNILGIEQELAFNDIYNKIKPTVDKLADVICKNIVAANGKSPSAVFLVGGGSQTPNLSSLVAQKLSIDESLVAVGSNTYIKRMYSGDKALASPQYATPLGIAITASKYSEYDTFVVTINGHKLHLFNIWDSSALNVLQMAGYRYSQIIGRAGSNITYFLNGERKIAWGTPSTAAELTINGKTAALSEAIHPGDIVQFIPAVCGNDACISTGDLAIESYCFFVTLEGMPFKVGRYAELNGEICKKSCELKNGDKVKTTNIVTLYDLCSAAGLDTENIGFNVNKKKQHLDYVLNDGDMIDIVPVIKNMDTFKNSLSNEQVEKNIKDEIRNAEKTADASGKKPENKFVSMALNGKKLEIPYKPDGSAPLYFDLLAYTNIDTKKEKGNIVQKLNGSAVSYLQQLKDGDSAEIYWD